jgi:transposase-like protein
MPPAKNSISRSSHPATFKEPAALKWLSSSLDTAQQALVELREDTGRDVSQGARELHKDLRAFISSARRDTGKLTKALQRDFEHAQKQLAQGTGTAGESRARTTTEPASRPAAKPKRVTAPGASNARAARSPEEKTATANPRTRTAATPTARVSSSGPEARTGGRRDQLLALVVDQPGITLAQAAKQFGLKDASGLYAVARRLQDDGLVRKSGAELHPAA